MKQYAPACERNSRPILEVLSPLLKDAGTVLEIGSGTGQHAVCFSAALPHVQWRPSDQPGATASVSAWRAESALPNPDISSTLNTFAQVPIVDVWNPNRVRNGP